MASTNSEIGKKSSMTKADMAESIENMFEDPEMNDLYHKWKKLPSETIAEFLKHASWLDLSEKNIEGLNSDEITKRGEALKVTMSQQLKSHATLSRTLSAVSKSGSSTVRVMNGTKKLGPDAEGTIIQANTYDPNRTFTLSRNPGIESQTTIEALPLAQTHQEEVAALRRRYTRGLGPQGTVIIDRYGNPI